MTTEDSVIIHIGSKIHHDTIIKNNCIVMPNVAMTGSGTVGENVFLGTGTICLVPIHISDNRIIQAGSKILNDVD